MEDVFGEAFDADPGFVVGSLCDLDAPHDAAAMRLALKYLSEWRVSAWAAVQNRTKGVEPPTEDCFLEHERVLETFPESVRPQALDRGSANAARMRGSRWRWLWGGSFAKLPSHDVLPVAEMWEKAL